MARKSASRTKKRARSTARKSPPAADAIRRLDAEFMNAASARDSAALARVFYAPEAVLMPPNHPIVEGRGSIQKFLQRLMDSGLTSVKLDTTATGAAGNLAYGRGRYVLSISPPGGTPVQDTGKYVVVYERQANGSWRALADIFNSDQPTP